MFSLVSPVAHHGPGNPLSDALDLLSNKGRALEGPDLV